MRAKLMLLKVGHANITIIDPNKVLHHVTPSPSV